ncbi:MAG: T9SS type A sorting domain-containing protein, partial [Ekhidna sp.]|nr:T9SS type A sorting domain-containing protein [Ekhidna sp.]
TTTLPITTNSTITWTYNDSGNSTTQTQEVTIADTEAPVPDVDNLPALTAAGSLARTAVTTPTATDNCDGQVMATTDAVFPITASTMITWTYEDEAGNTVTQTQRVTITEAPLGAAEDAAEVVIFPNPSGSYLEVRSSVGGTFKILSLSGKSLLEGTTNVKVDISSLRSGLYLVQLPDGHLLKFVRE